MKVVKEQYEYESDQSREWVSDEIEELAVAIKRTLTSEDYYTGRDVERTLDNVLAAFSELVDILTEKKILNVNDINRIAPIQCDYFEE